MMKRSIAAMAAILLILTVAGCSASPAESDISTATTDTTAPRQLLGAVGARKEHQVSLTVDWSGDKKLTGDVTIRVYVNGELDRSKTTVVDGDVVTSKTFTFSGSGKKVIKVKLNNDLVYLYTVDFDNATVNME